MEVASALLEASKKLSGSADSSTNSSCSATATWSSSMSEVGFTFMFLRWYEWKGLKCYWFMVFCNPLSPPACDIKPGTWYHLWKRKNPKENSVSLPPLSVTVLLNSFKEVRNRKVQSFCLFTFFTLCFVSFSLQTQYFISLLTLDKFNCFVVPGWSRLICLLLLVSNGHPKSTIL